MSLSTAVVREISARETWPLRLAILRPHQTLAEMAYDGDDAEASRHFGGFDGERLVGVASIYREPRPAKAGAPGEADPRAYRLRGMATTADVRGQGFGGVLLRRCLDHVAEVGGSELWCNARDTASGFYVHLGFEVLEGPFEIPGIGPHFLMRALAARATPSRPA